MKMLLKKVVAVKGRRKFRIFLLFIVLALVVLTLLLLGSSATSRGGALGRGTLERLLDFNAIDFSDSNNNNNKHHNSNNNNNKKSLAALKAQVLKAPKEHGIIVVEKYDERKIRERLLHEKLNGHGGNGERAAANEVAAMGGEEQPAVASLRDSVTTAVHIFYNAPVNWYKGRRSPPTQPRDVWAWAETTPSNYVAPKAARVLNTAFYPARGLYKPTPKLLQQHFEALRDCGVGVLILSLTGRAGEFELYSQLLQLLPAHNLSATFEISVAGNQSVAYLRQQLLDVRRYITAEAFYHVYSQGRDAPTPVIYVNNAYKLGGGGSGENAQAKSKTDNSGSSYTPSPTERIFCAGKADNLRGVLDAYYIGHIRLKGHAETMRRLCFEGFYSKLPSNGATFASTWKNWSYLKSFALNYKMLFVPTVGPGFAERNKFPRHGDIQRHRSNGRYYGVAWRTAILNHVGFINIASYNNWPDGSQIEEVAPRAGFLDYSPGTKTKYLDLTTHWVGNFMKTRREAAASFINGRLNCYELLNNTIC